MREAPILRFGFEMQKLLIQYFRGTPNGFVRHEIDGSDEIPGVSLTISLSPHRRGCSPES